jgi:hypothetical protein
MIDEKLSKSIIHDVKRLAIQSNFPNKTFAGVLFSDDRKTMVSASKNSVIITKSIEPFDCRDDYYNFHSKEWSESKLPESIDTFINRVRDNMPSSSPITIKAKDIINALATCCPNFENLKDYRISMEISDTSSKVVFEMISKDNRNTTKKICSIEIDADYDNNAARTKIYLAPELLFQHVYSMGKLLGSGSLSVDFYFNTDPNNPIAIRANSPRKIVDKRSPITQVTCMIGTLNPNYMTI